MAKPFSLRLPNEIKEKLQKLADATGRTKTFLAQYAIEKYLDTESWQINAIQEGIDAIENGQTISYEDVKKEWDLE